MEIWLDTANALAVERAKRLGVLGGVTTNPSLIAEEKKKNLKDLLKELLHHQEGPLAVQVMSDDTSEMVQQGQTLFSYSNRIVIKVPMTKKGLEALHLLSRQGIPTLATMVYSTRQALMAAIAGADYIAPYVSQLENHQGDPCVTLTSMMKIFQNYQLKTKILGASIKDVDQAMRCAEIGVYGITVKESIFEKLVEDHSLTPERLQKFLDDGKLINAPFLTGTRAVMF